MKPAFYFPLLALTFALALSAPVDVNAETYAGASVGRSEQQFSWGANNQTSTAFKLYGGHNFTRNFGVEAGYIAHGKATQDVGDFDLTYRASSLYVAGTATLPLTERFSLTGKLGVADNRQKVSQPVYGGATVTRTHAMAGVGASYVFAPGLSGVVEYEHFGKTRSGGEFNVKAHSLTVGVRRSF